MRDKLDRYYTPHETADTLRHLHKWLSSRGSIVEPFIGRYGAIFGVLQDLNESVTSLDIESDANPDYVWDVLTDDLPKHLIGSTIVSNPPFIKGQMGFVLNKLYQISNEMLLLLPMSILEPTKDRVLFLTDYPPDKILLIKRPSFFILEDDGVIHKSKGTANAQYAWMYWGKELKDLKPISVLPNWRLF